MGIKTIGRYEIISQVGRGAMGTVYRARDPLIDRTVAIKTLNPDVPQENMAEIKERFLREARSAGKLNHPNIVTIYDVGEDAGLAYIAMEFLDGESLRQVLDSRRRLSLETMFDITAQIADALEYAQRFGIVHRDIKPANIMLMASGTVKLADFGVAHIPASSVTMTGMIVGSPKYLSPEQVLGQPIDGRADIFSLGVVLYEMLAGRTPFDSPEITVFTLMHRTVSDPVPPASQFNKDVPAAIDAILRRALAKRPEDRYATAGDFAQDLRNFKRLKTSAATNADDTLPVADDATLIASGAGRPAMSAVANAVSSAHVAPKEILPEANMAQLLQDIEAFSRNFDEQSTLEQANAEARPHVENLVPLPALAPVPPKASEPLPASKDKSGTHSRLLDMLREQAQAKQGERVIGPPLESVLAFSRRLRQAVNYFAEFVAEFNRATPTFSGTLKLLYLPQLPALTLGRGFVDYRTRKYRDKEVIDYITLTYHMSAEEALSADLNKDEAGLLKAQLQRAQVNYEESEVKATTGRVPRSALSIPCTILANATLRADYDTLAVKFECRNVGLLGPARYRVEFRHFDNATIEEFGKLLLGLPNHFASFRYTQ
jgi:serine/threonine protein kinase